MKKLFVITILIIITLIMCGIYNEKKENIIVGEIHQAQIFNTDKHGISTSKMVLMVYTDKGAYCVEQQGLLAHPELFSKIHKGDTLTIDSRMFDCPFFGIYRTIVKAEKYDFRNN